MQFLILEATWFPDSGTLYVLQGPVRASWGTRVFFGHLWVISAAQCSSVSSPPLTASLAANLNHFLLVSAPHLP